MDVKGYFFLLHALVYKHSHILTHLPFSSPSSTPMRFFLKKKSPARIASFKKKKKNYSNKIDNLAIFRSDVIRKRLWFNIFVMVVWIFLCSASVHTASWLE